MLHYLPLPSLPPLTQLIVKISFQFRRQEELGNRIPASFAPLKATGDGNCLYNAVPILFFGDEEQADAMYTPLL